MGHSHLDHGKIVFRFKRQQPKRQTKMIVEISLRPMHAVLDRKQMGHRFFGSGLTHRAGNADGRLAPDFSHRRRQSLERNQSVVDRKQAGGAGKIGIARQLILPNHRGNRAPAQCLLNKIVPVKPFAFDRKKKFAGLHRARIDGISLRRSAVVLAARRQEFADAREKKFHAVFPALPVFAALSQS